MTTTRKDDFQVGTVSRGDLVILESSSPFEAVGEVVTQAYRAVYPNMHLLFYTLYGLPTWPESQMEGKDK